MMLGEVLTSSDITNEAIVLRLSGFIVAAAKAMLMISRKLAATGF